jgi:hypothetical protein
MTRPTLTIALALALSLAGDARAYDTETHAGLTERAALASSLHKRLIEHFGRGLGLYEPLELRSDGSPGARELADRLAALDPEGGYVPTDGRLTALGWLTAGSAVEGVPAARQRHHFYDPSTGRGLSETDGRALQTRIQSASSGVSSVRSIFTGVAFDGSGMASVEWLRDRDNQWGLQRFQDELERSAAAPSAAERDGALARAFIAAGSILHLLEAAGDPALVRNDYRRALETEDGPYERFTKLRYGRLAVPGPSAALPKKAHLLSLFHDADGSGLADRTQARFLSPGTLPPSGRYSAPSLSPGPAAGGYVAGSVPHLARYARADGGVSYWLDERCYADYAAALLPETAGYAAAALELLFRGTLEVKLESEHATITVREIALGAGTLSVYADVLNRPRVLVKALRVSGAAEGEAIGDVPIPGGARKLAAVFRGVDRAGEPLVLVQEIVVK